MAMILQHPAVAECRQTCEVAPEQYEGRLTDGRHFYFRFRFGRAQLGLGATVEAAVASTVIEPVQVHVDTPAGEYGACFETEAQRDAVFADLLCRWLHSSCDHGGKQVTCDRCGHTYICTPSADYYCTPEGDHCCEPCLLRGLPLIVVEPEIAGGGRHG